VRGFPRASMGRVRAGTCPSSVRRVSTVMTAPAADAGRCGPTRTGTAPAVRTWPSRRGGGPVRLAGSGWAALMARVGGTACGCFWLMRGDCSRAGRTVRLSASGWVASLARVAGTPCGRSRLMRGTLPSPVDLPASRTVAGPCHRRGSAVPCRLHIPGIPPVRPTWPSPVGGGNSTASTGRWRRTTIRSRPVPQASVSSPPDGGGIHGGITMTVHSEAARTGATPSALSNTAPRPSRSTPA